MPASQRAKQFLPFDAVAGLRQALKMKEHEMGLITRKELSEETAEEINEALETLRPGDHVSVAYFKEAGNAFSGGGKGFDEDEEDHGEEGEMTLIIGEVRDIDPLLHTVTVTPDDRQDDMHGFIEETAIKTDDIVSIDLFEEEL